MHCRTFEEFLEYIEPRRQTKKMATVNELKDEAFSLSEYLSDTAIESEDAFKAWYPKWYESQTGEAFSGKFNKAAWQVAIFLMTQALEKEEAKVMSEPVEGDTQELTTTELLGDEAGEDEVDPEYEAVKAEEEALEAAYQEVWNEVHKLAYQISGISFSEPEQLVRWYLETFHCEPNRQGKDTEFDDLTEQLEEKRSSKLNRPYLTRGR